MEADNKPFYLAAKGQHSWDEDSVCIKCGFDGAEWYHWKHNTYEGVASKEKQPLCTGGNRE
jgi:hypothetical protein